MRFIAFLLLFLPLQVLADFAKERRCTDLGAACKCSETLDVDQGVFTMVGSNYDFPNTPTASDCDHFEWSGTMRSVAAPLVGMPVGSTVAFVQSLASVGTQTFSGGGGNNYLTGPVKECIRWYTKNTNAIGHSSQAQGCNDKFFFGRNYNVPTDSFSIEEIDSPACGSGPPFPAYRGYSDLAIDSGESCAAYGSLCSDSHTSSSTLTYGPGDAINNWMRAEVCFTTRGVAGGNLGAVNGGPYWAEVMLKPLDGVSPEVLTRFWLGKTVWASRRPAMYIDMDIDHDAGDYWISSVMQANWATDDGLGINSAQRIGPSAELEGAGAVTTRTCP